METLSTQEIDQVGGGISIAEGAGATIALMGLAAASPFVIGAGCAALLAYGAMSLL